MRRSLLVALLAIPLFAQAPERLTGSTYSNDRAKINRNLEKTVMKDGSGNVTVTGTLSVGTAVTATGPVFNVKHSTYGAKGDERFFADAAMTASSSTLTSATAAFTSADTGKTATVNAGPRMIYTADYSSGGTFTGNPGQFCAVGSFNGGGTGAAGYVYFTSTNTIAAATALDITNPGTGFTSAPTGATLSKATIGTGTVTTNGTAVTWVSGTKFGSDTPWVGSPITINGVDYTIASVQGPAALTLNSSAGTQAVAVAFTAYSAPCSGSIVISSALVAAPLVATVTYVNATTVTLSSPATTTVTNARASIGTDDSAAFLAAFTAAAVKGGTVYAPAGKYLILSQILLPAKTSTPYNIQAPLAFRGDGMDLRPWVQWNDYVSPEDYTGTVLDMRYTGSGGKIQSGGASGSFTLSDMTLMDNGDDSTPYFHSTLVPGGAANRVFVFGVAFTDNYRKSGLYRTANKTAIEMHNNINGSVERCVFDRIKTGVLLAEFSNGNEVRNNYWTWTSGSDHTGAPILLDGSVFAVDHNEIHINDIEIAYFYYGIKLTTGANNNSIHSNHYPDVAGNTVASIWVNPGATRNMIFDLTFPGGLTVIDAEATSGVSSNAVGTTCGTGMCFASLLINGNLTVTGSTTVTGINSNGVISARVPANTAGITLLDTSNNNAVTAIIGNTNDDGSLQLYNLNINQMAFLTANGVSYLNGGLSVIKPPTSCSGQPAGALWNNAGTPGICP